MQTLTSIADAASYLNDRTLTDNVADELAKALRTATTLIESELRTTFTSTQRELLFDIAPKPGSTPGAFKSVFDQPYRPSFDLGTTGGVNGLTVQYRHSGLDLDADFSWDDATVLTEPADYLFYKNPGSFQLRFEPVSGPRRLRALFTEGYEATPEVLYGSAHSEHLSLTGADTAITPLERLVGGLTHKDQSDAPSAALTGGTPIYLDTVPPGATAMHEIKVHAPQNAGILDYDNPLTIRVWADDPWLELASANIQTPLPGQTYILRLDPSTTHTRYRVEFTGQNNGTLRPSLVEYVVADAETSHFKRSVPRSLSTACAMLAHHIYVNSMRAGNTNEKKKDSGKAHPTIPAQVARLLADYKPSRVRFI